MRLTQLIKSIGYKVFPDSEDFRVEGIACNSKQVSDNFIFVAIKGNNTDGHRFIGEAIQRGAKALVTQIPISRLPALPRRQAGGRQESQIPKGISVTVVKDTRKALAKLAVSFYEYPCSKIKVAGITGTNGKTTITYLIEAVLKEAGKAPAVIGTINYRFKDKIIPSRNTTPGPLEIQSMLSDMAGEGVDYAVMEVSSHSLEQERVEGIDFHSAVFTNLTQDHLDYHKTLESYFQAKAKLFKNIKPGSYAVINNDDPYGRRLKEITAARIVTYGIENHADILAKDIRLDIKYTQFLIDGLKGRINLTTRLLGRHNVYNILAAVSWAQAEGIDLSVIKTAIEKFCYVPGRLEKIDFKGDFGIFVDYAHTEDALVNVISALRQLTRNKIIVVFGCGGERDKTKRPKMGYAASELADYAIITNDNPRSEDPQGIIEDIKKGIRKDNFRVIPDRKEAIKESLSLAECGDIVLIAGKGHENCQILKDRTISFDDAQTVRECLKQGNY